MAKKQKLANMNKRIAKEEFNEASAKAEAVKADAEKA